MGGAAHGHDDLPPEALASIDAHASPLLHEKIGAEKEKYTSADAEYHAGSEKAKADATTRTSDLETEAKEAVKALFEAAKKLAMAAIEVARRAIVGLIKAYAAVLKALVSVALAAFPALRDKILKRIDAAVNRAVELVNRVADGLKKAVAAVLDFLAKTIDSLLKLVQDIYNGILTVVGMIVSGEFAELMKKLGQVVAAARTAPGQFETAAYEELLGGDLDQPLSPAELIAAGRQVPSDLAQQGGGVAAGAGPHSDVAAAGSDQAEGEPAHADGEHADGDEPAPQPPWTEDKVGVDQVAHGEELEPDLAQEVRTRTGGGDGTVEFGESSDGTRSLDYMVGRSSGQDAGTRPTTNDTPAHAPEAQGQDAGQLPATEKGVDGLSPRERAAVKWQLMKKGLADWWTKHWPYVLAGGILAVAGFIVANILTGGAILAALPPIMTVVGEIMMGVAIMKIVEHVRDFLQKGWSGDIRGGGKSLAKGLAPGAIELIILLTFKVGEAAVKGARVAARGVVRGAQAAARGTARAGRAAVRGLERGAEAMARSSVRLVAAIGRGVQYVIKAGKVLVLWCPRPSPASLPADVALIAIEDVPGHVDHQLAQPTR